MKTFLDGHLHLWIEDMGTIQRLQNSRVISVDLTYLESHIGSLIRKARQAGDNWLWSYDDIYKEEDEKEWQLPSVDIAGHFGLDTNNDLKKFFKKKKLNLGISWDTESSAWYPRFKHIEDAKRCVDTINDLFDERYGTRVQDLIKK